MARARDHEFAALETEARSILGRKDRSKKGHIGHLHYNHGDAMVQTRACGRCSPLTDVMQVKRPLSEYEGSVEAQRRGWLISRKSPPTTTSQARTDVRSGLRESIPDAQNRFRPMRLNAASARNSAAPYRCR